MDAADRASQLEEAQRQSALASHQQNRQACTPQPAQDCQECGDPIPAARQAAYPAAQHCISCATHLEQQAARHA